MAAPCYFSKAGDLKCSSSDHYHSDDNLVPLYSCQKDTKAHLRGLNSSESFNIPESLLILYRSGIFEVDEESMKLTICQSHRDFYGIYWKRCTLKCCLSDHPSAKRPIADRGASPSLCRFNWRNGGEFIPVGAGICKRCSTKMRVTESSSATTSSMTSFEDEIERIWKLHEKFRGVKDEVESEIVEECMTESQPVSSCSLPSSQTMPESEEEWMETNLSAREKMNSGMKILSDNSFVPLRSQLLSPIAEIQRSTKFYYISKAREAVMIILGLIAPGQENVLLKEVYQNQTEKEDPHVVDGITEQLIESYYKTSDKKIQNQILSIFVKKYTKQKLMNLMPTLTHAKIDSARKHASIAGPGQPANTPKIYRIRLTKPKLLHFLEYVSSPSVTQVLGCGQTELKLSSGEKIQMPKVIRNAVSGRIIDNYLGYCREENFDTFSRASLYRILKCCKASKKKALQGLDNTIANGMIGIETLQGAVMKLEAHGLSPEKRKFLVDAINICSEHMKFEMKTHINRKSQCQDHCSTFSLSDPKERCYISVCEHSHTEKCLRCALTTSVAGEIKEEMERLDIHQNELKEELIYDIQIASKYIYEWKAHLTRTVHQDIARTDILHTLKPSQAFLIMDWAMKFLPLQYRETQSDFYGKKGISWHISCLITKNNNSQEQLDLDTYIHILENGNQGWFSVANILKHLFCTIKSHFPLVEEIFIKSDNAGCYHCVPIIAFLAQNFSKFPIKVKQYNFSEAQSGKDLCDSKTGSCRMHIAKYMNEGNNIMTASDLKKSLESNGGVKGVHLAIISIDKEKEPKIQTKLPGVSLLNNITFKQDRIVVRKAFNVGEGKSIPVSSLKDKNLDVDTMNGLQIKDEFRAIMVSGKLNVAHVQHTERNNETEEARSTSELSENMPLAGFSCSDPSCTRQYVNISGLERHLALGNHLYKETEEPAMDSGMKIWADKCTSIRTEHNTLIQNITTYHSKSGIVSQNMGWALKSVSKSARFTPKVKTYLMGIFQSCDKSGNRPNYGMLSQELKRVCEEDGSRKFSPDEWLTPNQIRGVFASYMLKQKNNNERCVKRARTTDMSTVTLEEIGEIHKDELLSEVVSELKAEEFEVSLSTMYGNVYDSLNAYQ